MVKSLLWMGQRNPAPPILDAWKPIAHEFDEDFSPSISTGEKRISQPSTVSTVHRGTCMATPPSRWGRPSQCNSKQIWSKDCSTSISHALEKKTTTVYRPVQTLEKERRPGKHCTSMFDYGTSMKQMAVISTVAMQLLNQRLFGGFY